MIIITKSVIIWRDNVFWVLWDYIFVQWYVSHYNDAIVSTMVSQITSLTIVYSNVYSGAD